MTYCFIIVVKGNITSKKGLRLLYLSLHDFSLTLEDFYEIHMSEKLYDQRLWTAVKRE